MALRWSSQGPRGTHSLADYNTPQSKGKFSGKKCFPDALRQRSPPRPSAAYAPRVVVCGPEPEIICYHGV